MADKTFVQMVRSLAIEIQTNPDKYALVKENCNNQRSCEDIFSFLWNLEDTQKMLNPTLVPSMKSELNATRLREEGNEYYKKMHFDKALVLYNLSIAEAPHPVMNDTDLCENAGRKETYLCPLIQPSKYGGVPEGETTALATGFANRSAIMFELKLHEKCIMDIDLAIKYGFPKERQKHLENRKLMSLTELNKLASPKKVPQAESVSFRTTVVSPGATSDANTDTDFCEKLLSSLQISEDQKPIIHPIFSYKVRALPTMPNVNENVPALSSAVKVSFNPSKGRCLIATRDIEPGEVLGVEEAHSVYVDTQKLYLHCSSCLRITFNPLPCPACPKVAYCSETCRLKGLTEEHWLECALLPTLIALGLPERNLLCKLFKTLTYSQLNDFVSRLRKEEENNEGKVYPDMESLISSSYKSVYNLCTNQEKQTFEFIFMQGQIALIITKLLLQSGRFFINERGEHFNPSTEEIVKTGAILLLQGMKVQCNPFQIFDLQIKETVGGGVFSALSLINHSCYPSARHHANGRNLIIRAIRPMPAGEEITVSYVYEFHKQIPVTRQKILSRYKFTCTCEACEKNWPSFLHLPALNFKCLDCKIPMEGRLRLCPACDTKNRDPKTQLSTLSPEWQKEVDTVCSGVLKAFSMDINVKNGVKITEEDYQSICETLKCVYRHVTMPCQHVIILQNFLYKCFEDGF